MKKSEIILMGIACTAITIGFFVTVQIIGPGPQREEIRTNYIHITRPQDLGQVQEFHKFWVNNSKLALYDGVVEAHYPGQYNPELRTFSIINGSEHFNGGTFIFTDSTVMFVDFLRNQRAIYSINPHPNHKLLK